MSDGARISIEEADALARRLYAAWELGPGCDVVGSVRRRRDWVGDLELVMPHRPAGDDPECRRIQATMEVGGGLFSSVPSLGRPLRGLKPGFLAASLMVRLDEKREVGVQIFRYTPINAGWVYIERTGPTDFGRWFLGKWKEARGIPVGDENFQASVDGNLVDRNRAVVTVENEAKAFNLACVRYIAPHQRDAHMAWMNERRAGAR